MNYIIEEDEASGGGLTYGAEVRAWFYRILNIIITILRKDEIGKELTPHYCCFRFGTHQCFSLFTWLLPKRLQGKALVGDTPGKNLSRPSYSHENKRQ